VRERPCGAKLVVDIVVHSPGSGRRPLTIRDAFFRERAANRSAALSCLRSVSLRRMAIVTKRNAVVGWITLKYGKRVAIIVVRDQKRQLMRKLPFRHKR
jgi:hypothetical protein